MVRSCERASLARRRLAWVELKSRSRSEGLAQVKELARRGAVELKLGVRQAKEVEGGRRRKREGPRAGGTTKTYFHRGFEPETDGD